MNLNKSINIACAAISKPVVGLVFMLLAGHSFASSVVSVQEGKLQGAFDTSNQVHTFKGVPFASPPIGELRWQSPQKAKKWQGTRSSTDFSNQCMQLPLFDDMKFRSSGISEDCLYLNIWTANLKPQKKMPVLLYFYGGGFAAGDASEPRYDGANMAQKGIVVITANYRLGIFGLLSHPELSAQTQYAGSGNYTFMDQAAALQWVVDNVAQFGGDPKRITIAGESAGSLSVSGLMVSPLSKNNIAGAIGESGSLLGPTLSTQTLAQAETNGSNMAAAIATDMGEDKPLTLTQLKQMPAKELLERANKAGFQWFMPTVDNYVFLQAPLTLYKNGHFAKVPLLAGNNSQEGSYQQILGEQEITQAAYKEALKRLYPSQHEQVFQLYRARSKEEIMDAAQALASDRFISFSTWNWADLVAQKNSQSVYYYEFSKIRPASVDLPIGADSGQRGALHSAEIEYALGNLNTHPAYQWQEDDFVVSTTMQRYFANFIHTGNPNDAALPAWPLFSEGKQMEINVTAKAQDISSLRARYQFHRLFYADRASN